MTHLLDHLRARVEGGRKLLVPYLVGGLPERASASTAIARLSRLADAVEVGLPYSDPLMDGPAIASAAERVLNTGIGPLDVLDIAGASPAEAPLIAMTYFNPIHRVGDTAFCRRAASAGIGGLIVPDIPFEESEGVRTAAAAEGLAWIPLVAPTSTVARVEAIAKIATGFVYAVSSLGVTGTRGTLSEQAARVVALCREVTDLPVLVGIGVSTPAHAVEACEYADGVVIGSAVVTRLVEGGIDAAEQFLEGVRSALDAGNT